MMVISDVIIASITNFFRMYIIWRFIRLFFNELKIEEKYEYIVYGLFYLITLLFFLIYHLPFLNIITNIVCLFGIMLIYSGSYKKKLAVTILIYSVNMVCDLLAAFLFMNYTAGEPTTQVFSIVTDLLILICEIIAARILGKEARQDYNRSLKILLIIPMLSIIMLHFLVTANLGNRKLLAFEGMSILIINMVVFYLYHELMKVHWQLYEKEILELQIVIYANQLEIINQTQKKVHILRHDMIHHVKELSCLVLRDENHEAMKYLNKMESFIHNEREYVQSGNKDIDGILNYMLGKAKQELKQVETQIKIPRGLNTNTFELTIILGNLLDNAIEAAKQADEKIVGIKIYADKGLLFIEVSNTYKGKIYSTKDRIITSKADKWNHGLGLESVKEIVNRNNGAMNVVYDNNKFEVDVMLYLSVIK